MSASSTGYRETILICRFPSQTGNYRYMDTTDREQGSEMQTMLSDPLFPKISEAADCLYRRFSHAQL